MIHIQRVVNRIFASNTYVVSCDGYSDVWLVDIGDSEKVADILNPSSLVRGVFLTHTHFDHIYGINELYDRFPDMVVYVAEPGVSSLYSAKQNLSFYHGTALEYKGRQVVGLGNKSIVELYPGISLTAISTPGHSPDSLSYFLDNEYLFSGDAYIPNVKVVSKLPGGNKELAAKSTELLSSLAQGKVLFPGHGKATQYGDGFDSIAFL